MNEWVVLELSQKSEGEDPDVLRTGILSSIRQSAEVFIPAAVTQVGGDRVIHYLMEGYAFVRRTLPDEVFFRLEGTRYVQAVLTKPNAHRDFKSLATVGDDHIHQLRLQIDAEVNQGIGVGDTVLITSGHYRHIEATVIEEIPEQDAVQVFIKLRSKQTIITLPRSFLQVSSRSPMSPLITRLSALRAWTHIVAPVFAWNEHEFIGISNTYKQFERLNGWAQRGSPLYSFLRFVDWPLAARVGNKLQEIERMNAWLRQAGTPARLIKAHSRLEGNHQFLSLEGQIMELSWFDDVLDRGRSLRGEINELLRKIATRRRVGVGNVQNVIVDGHNLAFRCLYAPGMADLTDSQGRPTGIVLGFLRSLGALKKRFPTAAFYVSWDGSSQRRKASYSEYKANRHVSSGSPIFDQMDFLRSTLPYLGCYQVFNPKEEADDVIATLVRKKLVGQRNLIFGTDRDFLQLVTESTLVLIPATGSRKELLFDPAAVKAQYGVMPEAMVQLRALLGDPSDNIPGVPRVPKKVLKSLVQAHGSVDGIYRSGLAGLTKMQYERVRSAEPQVRINLDLMVLQDIPFTKIDPDPKPDEATSRLREIEINPTPILETFFEQKSSELATGLAL